MKITPVFLCGGSGTRLWPLSCKIFPINLSDRWHHEFVATDS